MMKSRLLASVTSAVLCLGAAAPSREPSFQEHAAVQESLARGRDAGLDFHCSEMTISER